MPIFTLCSSAKAMSPGQTDMNSALLSSGERAMLRPMKVLTMPTPSLSAPTMHFFRWLTATARCSGSPERVLG